MAEFRVIFVRTDDCAPRHGRHDHYGGPPRHPPGPVLSGPRLVIVSVS